MKIQRLAMVAAMLGVVSFSVLQPTRNGAPVRAASTVNWQWKGSSFEANTTDLNNMSTGLQQLVATGANSVTFVVPWYTPSIYSTDMYPLSTNTPSDASLISAIQLAESYGLKVVIKLHLESQDGSWRAFINPNDYQTWFTNYTSFVLHYADIGQQYGVSLIVIGSELIAMATNPYFAPYWRTMVATVRQHFSGQLTYNANWGSGTPPWNTEYPAISWWDSLDYIGISAYFNLTTTTDASVSQILAGWPQYESDLASIQQQYNKPILFTEGGYRNVPFTAEYPWEWTAAGTPDAQAQVNAYEALFEYWGSSYPWFAGMETWEWNTTNTVDPNSTGYEVQNKPAYTTVQNWFGGPPSTLTPGTIAAPTATGTLTPSAYRTAVLNDGPTAYYRLDEASGSLMYDSSGNGNNGLYTGVALGAPGLTGDGDTAVSLSGSGSSYGSTPNLPALSGSFSLEAWVVPQTTSNTYEALLSTTAHNYMLAYAPGAQRFLVNFGTSSAYTYNSTHTYAPGVPYYVVYSYDSTSGTSTLYVNGVADGTWTGPQNNVTPNWEAGVTHLGWNSYPSPLKGTLDDVALYNTALSAAQVQSHYDAAEGIVPTPTNTPVPSATTTPCSSSSLAPISLSAGWNLLGLPTTNYTSAAALATEIQSQNPGLTVSLISVYANGRYLIYVPGFSSDLSLHQGEGIMVLTSRPGVWTPQGSPPATSVSLALVHGWNLISVPYPGSMTAATVISQLNAAGLNPQEIAAWSGGSWQTYLANGTGTNGTISCEQGFMALVSSSGTWTPQ